MNFPKNSSKQQKDIVQQYMAQFVEKNSFCYYLSHFSVLIKKSCLNKSKFSTGLEPFKHGKKYKLSEYFSARFEIVPFKYKWKVLYEFPQKTYKTTERQSLAVCGLLCWEKRFLLIFIPFYWFDQKQLFKQIQIFLRICPFSNMVRKTNFLSFSVIVFESVTFVSKNKSSLWISSKMLQNNRKA